MVDQSSSVRVPWLVTLTACAIGVHLAAMAAVGRLRGDPTAYAYQSPDAAEYVALARGIARAGRFVRVDAEGHAASEADVWRTPGYPALLAAWIALFGDSTLGLLVLQQVIAAATVPLLYAVIRSYTSGKWSWIAAVAWGLDPFRVYYSLWLMGETPFVLLLLAGLWVWTRGHRGGWTVRWAAVLGVAAGTAVLVRPIGIVLPALACLGVAIAGGRASGPRGLRPALVCVGVSAAIVGAWMVRSAGVAGHFALSSQAGASLAYHKVADVVLWSEGRSDRRFDAEALAEVRDRVDERVRERWRERHGTLSEEERADLTWRRLNFGETRHVDPFEASSVLTAVGLEMMGERKRAVVACFATQGVGMLVFPLGLVVSPPESAAPLSSLFGGGGGIGRQVVPAIIGTAYGLLFGAVVYRVIQAARRRRLGGALFALWPMLGLFVLSLPFEDPRFRLPLVPMMWIIAVPPRCLRDVAEVRSEK